MTQEAEKNLTFIKDSTTYAGFGNAYHNAIEKGIRAGDSVIKLEPAWKQFDGATVIWEPKVTESNVPGRYNFNGMQTTLEREGEKPISQFFNHFKMAGATAENALSLLEGRTVLVKEWDNKQNGPKFSFQKLDLSQPVVFGDNYPVIRVNSKDLELGRLYSQADVVGSQADKEKHLAQLQAGEIIPVRIREQAQGGEPRYIPAFLQLNLQDSKTMGLKIMDSQGIELRQPVIEAKSQELTKTRGMNIGDETHAKLPESLMRLLEEKNYNAGAPRIGGPKNTAA